MFSKLYRLQLLAVFTFFKSSSFLYSSFSSMISRLASSPNRGSFLKAASALIFISSNLTLILFLALTPFSLLRTCMLSSCLSAIFYRTSIFSSKASSIAVEYLSENSIQYAALMVSNFPLVCRSSLMVSLVVSIIAFTYWLICLMSIVSSLLGLPPITFIIVKYIFNYLSIINLQLKMNDINIAIISKYKGAQWAGKILKDWGKNICYGQILPSTQLIIIDACQQGNYKKQTCDKVILKDVNMSPHHILAQSSVLTTFGQQKQHFFPHYIVELTVSNGLAIIALQLLFERKRLDKSYKPKTHYISIVQLVKYFGAFNISAKEVGMISKPRGQNVLQGGAPYYSVYKCKQGFLAVGNLEPKFYMEMIRGLELSAQERQFCENGQFTDEMDNLRKLLATKFMEKTAKQWEKHYFTYDTCITQIKYPFKSEIREPRLIDLKPHL